MKNVLPAVCTALIAALLPWLATPASAAWMPKCSDRVVWIIPPMKAYVLSNNPLFGKKPGSYSCQAKAIARGYRMRPLNIMRPIKHNAGTSHAATPKPQPTATPALSSVPENPSLTTLARSQIDMIRSRHVSRAQYGDQLNAVLTDNLIARLSQALNVGGAVTSFGYAGTTNVSGLPVAQYLIGFEHPIGATNQWIESIAADPAGKVLYLSFAPKT